MNIYANFISGNDIIVKEGTGMRKMDEMEMLIALKSARIAWAYTVVFLFIWVVSDYLTTRMFGWAFFLLITQNLVLLISQLILKHRMSG